jgi:hypothetical protein
MITNRNGTHASGELAHAPNPVTVIAGERGCRIFSRGDPAYRHLLENRRMPIMFVDSIEERLTKAIRGINLIKLALAADATETAWIGAMSVTLWPPLASEVHEEIFFARHALPAPIKALPAPGLDEEGETIAQYESRMAADRDAR